VAYERNDSYKQLRLFLDPGPVSGQLHVTVVARTSRRGSHHDRVLAHRVFPGDLGTQTVATVVSRAGEFLLAIAEHLGPVTPQRPEI